MGPSPSQSESLGRRHFFPINGSTVVAIRRVRGPTRRALRFPCPFPLSLRACSFGNADYAKLNSAFIKAGRNFFAGQNAGEGCDRSINEAGRGSSVRRSDGHGQSDREGRPFPTRGRHGNGRVGQSALRAVRKVGRLWLSAWPIDRELLKSTPERPLKSCWPGKRKRICSWRRTCHA